MYKATTLFKLILKHPLKHSVSNTSGNITECVCV